MKRILSVDWDFFFPVPNADPEVWQMYDWGHREGSDFFLNTMWYLRASAFKRAGMELPGLSGEQEHFWERFNLDNAPPLYYADSHKHIAELFFPECEIVNYDAHHDAGYGRPLAGDSVQCDDWAHYAVENLSCKVKTVYPSWKKTVKCLQEASPDCKQVKRAIDKGKKDPKQFDAVFVCRSGSWVPNWLDNDFEKFLEKAGLEAEELQSCKNRKFDAEYLESLVEQEKAAFASMRESMVART